MSNRYIGKHTITCACVAMAFSMVALSGCQKSSKPRLRNGAFFGSLTGMHFPDPNYLANHHYDNKTGEKLGMVYTCQAGFIDVGPVRESADRTAYLAGITFRKLMLKQTEFTFRVIEPSRYRVKLSYPENWDDLSLEEQETIAREVSICLGQYFAHTSLIWHEILTWYGFSSTWIFSENISAFSWEDTYSDLLGTCLATQALRGTQQKYDEAMTALIDEAFRELDVQPSKVARRAAREVNGKWFSGGYYFFVDMKKRNFDTGLSDGQIMPWLVPDICPDAEPMPYRVPGLDVLSQHGFEMELEIESREMEKGRIYHDLGLKNRKGHIQPAVHFPEILEAIKKQAIKKGYLSDE